MDGGRGRGVRVGSAAHPLWLASNDADGKATPVRNSLRV